MAEWNRIYSKFWDSKLRERIGSERHLVETWMWIVYNESASTIGIYRPNLRRMAADVCADGTAAVSAELSRLQELSPSSVRWDPESGYVWVVNAVSYQHDAQLKETDHRTKSKQLESELSVAAKSPFWAEFLTTYRSHVIGRIATGEIGRERTRGSRVSMLPDGWPSNDPSEDDGIGSEGSTQGGQKGLRRGFEGASKGLRGPSSPDQAKPSPTKPTTFGEEPRVARNVPTERTPDEDGCPFKDVPHSAEDTHAQPEPDESTEAPREEQRAVRVGPPAVGSPKAGGPTFRDSGTVRDGHPAAGMGSTRPPPPLVTLAEWQALPLDAKVKHVQAPATCAQDLRDHAAVVRRVTDSVLGVYRAATESAGFEVDPEAFDAIDRAVVVRLERESPEAAADTLRRLVAWASTAPDGQGVGKPVRGRAAWLSAWALFGAPENATKGWKSTPARLPENVNAMVAAQGAKAKADERKLRVVRPDEPDNEGDAIPEGFTLQELSDLFRYKISMVRKVDGRDPAKDARLAEYDAAIAAQRAERANRRAREA